MYIRYGSSVLFVTCLLMSVCSKDRVRMTETTVHCPSGREVLTKAARALGRQVADRCSLGCDSIHVFLRVHFILPILQDMGHYFTISNKAFSDVCDVMVPVGPTSGLVRCLVFRIQCPIAVLPRESLYGSSKYLCQWDLPGWFLKTFNT